MNVDQVDRHYRYHRENWKYIATTLSNSGNTFDEKRCMVNILESEKEKICVNCLYRIYSILESEINSLVRTNIN